MVTRRDPLKMGIVRTCGFAHAETAAGRLDTLDPDHFKCGISAHETSERRARKSAAATRVRV